MPPDYLKNYTLMFEDGFLILIKKHSFGQAFPQAKISLYTTGANFGSLFGRLCIVT